MIWVVPLLPALGFVVNGLFGTRFLTKKAVAWIACSAVLLSFLLSLGAILALNGVEGLAPTPGLAVDHNAHRVTLSLYTWMPMGRSETGENLSVDWSYSLDPLSAVMLLVVTGVGFLIHVYSVGYMEHEPGPAYARFFAYLNLFMAMMLTLVLGASLPVVFVGWEGVGLCSYLLIGFYYDRMFDEKARMTCADAGRKAFIVNRIGDVGFILGMLLLFAATGTLEIQGVLGKVGGLGTGVCTLAALLLFIGACGKSAQIPLYVWLPDAMAGPTPVSALIHAATMVTAGVYVTCRMAPLYLHAPAAMTTVAVVGALMALFGAIIGTAQDDIKKVLAYSTVSQLGYMMLAAGVGAFPASIFHLTTHAFFKALLFLGAGSVIHAMSGEQSIKMMGGLRRHLPVTHATFAIAVLAIAGIPPFAGFFSKDGILAGVLGAAGEAGSGLLLGLWVAGVLTARITAVYMTRLYVLVFAGAPRMSDETRRHLHESPVVMTLPLIVLAVGSALAGLLGVPEFLSRGTVTNYVEAYLGPVLQPRHIESAVMSVPSDATALAITLVASLAGIAAAWAVYGRRPLPAPPAGEPGGFVRVVKEKFYVDEAIEAVVVRPYYGLCRAAATIDEKVVDGLVNAAAAATDLVSQMVRLAQTGYVRNYALVFFLATILILLFAMR